MPRFACPHCKSVHRAAEEERGNVVICQQCGRKIRVPAGKSRTTGKPGKEAPIRATPRPERRPQPRSKPGTDTVDEVVAVENEREKNSPLKRKGKKGMAMTNVAGSAGGLIVLAGFLLVVTGKWTIIGDWIQAILVDQGIHPLIAIVISAAVLIGIVGLVLLFTVKSAILGAIPDNIDFTTAKAADWEDLNFDKLVELSNAFAAQGFQKLTDYTVDTDISESTVGFARLFYHSTHRCFAEINQAFRKDGEPVPMRCVISSFLEDGWSVSTTDRQPSKEGYLMRRPRAAWRSLPDADLADLLADHRKSRKGLMNDLEIDLLSDATAKAYFAQEKKANHERKDAVRARWAPGIFLEFWLFDRSPKMEWRGELKKKVKSDE